MPDNCKESGGSLQRRTDAADRTTRSSPPRAAVTSGPCGAFDRTIDMPTDHAPVESALSSGTVEFTIDEGAEPCGDVLSALADLLIDLDDGTEGMSL